MHNSKLIAILKTFSSKELREFKDFVSSPFYNKNEELVHFYIYLKKSAPEFSFKKVERENAYASIFPGKKYDEKHLNYLMSFLLKLTEKYIGLKKYENKGILADYHILEACVERDLQKHYQNLYQKSKSKLAKSHLRDANYYYQNYLLADVADKHFQNQKIRRFDKNLQHATNYFDLFYLSNKLKFNCEMLDREKVLSVDYQHNMIDEVMDYLKNNDHDQYPSIAIYYQIFLSLTEKEGDVHFEKLKHLLLNHFHEIGNEEMKHMHLAALNFCIRKVRQKENKYVEEAFNLFLKGIENRLLYENNHLSPWTFKNVVKLGLRLKRFDWTEQFILEYQNHLDEEFRQNALHYNLADLYYYKKDLNKALTYLQKVEYSDVFYALHSKVMLLKIYYELDEEEALFNLLASFRIYLKRNKLISNSVRETYQNFISILTQIVKSDPKQIQTIKEKIVNTELLTDRAWLNKIFKNPKRKSFN